MQHGDDIGDDGVGRAADAADAPVSQPLILIVAKSCAAPSMDRFAPSADRLVVTTIGWLAAYLTAADPPDVVLCPLLGERYDVHDVAEIAFKAGYRGRVRGLSFALPRPDLIRCEVRENFPGLDFDILEVREGEVLHAAVDRAVDT